MPKNKIKPEDLDDELGSPPGAENYQKMFDQPESQGGDPKKRIMPKKKPKEFKKKDKPVTMILEKESIEFIGKNKKSKGGLIKGFPRLAKKGF